MSTSTRTITRLEKAFEKAKPITLALSALTLDPRLQMRAAMDDDHVRQYAGDMERGATFPPLHVIDDQQSQKKFLACGWHREKALRALKHTDCQAKVVPGTYEEAEDYVMTLNATHGKRRTHADTQKVILHALKTKRWQARSDRWIANHCSCDHKTVTVQREQLESTGEIPQLTYLRGEDGKDRRRTPAKKAPAPPPPAKKTVGVSATPPTNEATPLGTPKRATDHQGNGSSSAIATSQAAVTPEFQQLVQAWLKADVIEPLEYIGEQLEQFDINAFLADMDNDSQRDVGRQLLRAAADNLADILMEIQSQADRIQQQLHRYTSEGSEGGSSS